MLPGRLLRGPLAGGHQDFSVRAVRHSVERSLRRLGTDHVDLLLLHECSPEQVTDELLGFLSQCVTDGKALAAGTATNREATVKSPSQGSFPARRSSSLVTLLLGWR